MISPDITRFVLTSIPSVPYLEAILLLQRENSTAWSGHVLARFLYISESKADALLGELKEAGIAVVEDGSIPTYRYSPASKMLQGQIDELVTIYPRNVIEITNLIHSSSKNRVQQFADAFKLRKDS